MKSIQMIMMIMTVPNFGRALDGMDTAATTRATRTCDGRNFSNVRSMRIVCSGFGQKKSQASKKSPKIARYLEKDVPVANTSASPGPSDDWLCIPDVDVNESFLSKPIKAVILASGKAICLFKVRDAIYCTDANSTAFKYPLSDAAIIETKTGPAVEVKLDGTVYDLSSGKVLSWCPKNNPFRSVLGSLKDKTEPEDLPVYPTRISGSNVFVKIN